MGTTPNFPKTIRTANAAISTANTNRDGSGTVGTLFTAQASFGSDVTRIIAKATGTTTAGMLRFFAYDGTNYRLELEVDVAAVTPSATVKAWTGIVTFGASSFSVNTSTSGVTIVTIPGDPLKLAAGYSLRVSTHNGESFVVVAEGRDYEA